MNDNNVITLHKPEQNDPCRKLLREGAHKLLAHGYRCGNRCLYRTAQRFKNRGTVKWLSLGIVICRNGQFKQEGGTEIKVSKVRDRSGAGINFNSSLVPPYLKRTNNIEEFVPWLYLRGISTGDFSEISETAVGAGDAGLIGGHYQWLKTRWGAGLSRPDSTQPE